MEFGVTNQREDPSLHRLRHRCLVSPVPAFGPLPKPLPTRHDSLVSLQSEQFDSPTSTPGRTPRTRPGTPPKLSSGRTSPTIHSPSAPSTSNQKIDSILEINVGIITGCLPVLRPLLKRLLPSGKGSSWLISSIRLRFARSLHSNSSGQPSPPSESDGRSSESTTGIASKGGADGVAVARHEERYGAPAGAIGGRGRGVNETTVVGGHTRNGASSRITAKGDVWLEGEEERDREGHGYGSKNGVLSIRKTVGVDVV